MSTRRSGAGRGMDSQAAHQFSRLEAARLRPMAISSHTPTTPGQQWTSSSCRLPGRSGSDHQDPFDEALPPGHPTASTSPSWRTRGFGQQTSTWFRRSAGAAQARGDAVSVPGTNVRRVRAMGARDVVARWQRAPVLPPRDEWRDRHLEESLYSSGRKCSSRNPGPGVADFGGSWSFDGQRSCLNAARREAEGKSGPLVVATGGVRRRRCWKTKIEQPAAWSSDGRVSSSFETGGGENSGSRIEVARLRRLTTGAAGTWRR